MRHLCEALVGSVEYLKRKGMPVEYLRALHHPMSRAETFASTLRYFGTKRNLKGKNAAFAERVMFVATEHERGRGSLAALVEGAIRRRPIAGI